MIPCFQLHAQTGSCVLMDPVVNINFGVGDAEEMNTNSSYMYRRVESACPTDGHYTYTPYTSDCFRGDWITLTEDHTPGDQLGNMLLVNASYESGEFFSTVATGLKPGTIYEFAVWMLNVCKPSDKCPFPLLPKISIRLETVTGKLVAELNTGSLPRYGTAQWTKFSVLFPMPREANILSVTMIDYSPGGCGNDFAVDDITFRECVPPPPVAAKKLVPPAKTKTPVTKPESKKDVTVNKPAPKKPVMAPMKRSAPSTSNAKKNSPPKPAQISTPPKDSSVDQIHIVSPPVTVFRPPPPPLKDRTNALVKRIETGPGEIRIDLYDNGEIDGDTVTVYHNNEVVLSRAGLSQKALSFRIKLDENNPHHELVMVANNLGSIPPNTSLMIVTAGTQRYEVFISSTEQKNAKVIIDLKK